VFNLTTFLLSLFIAVALIPVMTKLAARFHMVDFPNPRKVHARPIPRIGGAAIAIGAFIPIIFWTTADDFIIAYLLGAAILVVFGIVDDMRGLGYKTKFLGQLLAALVIVFYGGVRIVSLGGLLPDDVILADWFATALTLVLLVGVINAINLADGLDGLAGGISLLSFCCIGYLAYLLGDNVVLLISLSMAGAIFGFLRFNTYPASLFMGDTGSQLLGFSAGVLAIKITQSGNPLSPILPLIILGFPILDTLTVMIERIREGRSPFSADKNHFHHRLISFGLFHTESVFVIYIIQAVLVVSAIFLKYYSDWMLLGGYLVFATLIIGTFALGDRMAFQFKRFKLIDYLIKGKLKIIKDERWIIKTSFNITRFLIPQIFLFATIFPVQIPGYFFTVVLCLSLLIVFVWIFKKKYMNWVLRGCLYLIIPLILYLTEQEKAAWISRNVELVYLIFFIIGTFFIILTVKYSQRKKGFQATTMDFLILFIAIVVPNLPDQLIQSHHMGQLAVEIIVLFFSYEVLITELRGRLDPALTASTLAALMLIGVRGITGV
jgi:UDP-GlcNAc:undecaprenyl-phosphate GlcNAc-1-phosphate transferase